MEPGKDKHRILVEHMPDAFAYHRIVTDRDGKPVDYVFLDVNPAFEEMTGLIRGDIIGKKVTEVHPGIEESDFDWIGTYGNVASGGESLRFEKHFDIAARWYSITAYSDEPGYFAVVFRDISTSKEELSRSEERLLNVLSLIPDMISIHDPDMNILYSNWSGFASVPEEKRKQNAKCYRTYRDHDGICPDCEAVSVLQTREPFRKQVELPEGIWIDLHVIPILKEDGSVDCFVEWVRDITEQKTSERDMLTLVEHAPDMVVRFGARLEHIYCNAAVEKVFGVPKEFFLGKTFPDLAKDMKGQAEGDLLPIQDTLERCMETREEQQVEFSLRLQGEEKWFSTRVVPEGPSEGHVETLLTVTRDVTDWKKAELEATAQHALLEGIMDGVSDVLSIQRPDHTIEHYNQAGYDLLDMTPEEVRGKKCYELLGRDRECDECATRKALQSRKIEHLEKYVPELGVYLDCRSHPVLEEDGSVGRLIQQLRDITGRKEQEQRLQDSERRLNTLISHTPAVIYSYSLRDGTPEITYVNENIRRVLGIKPEELVNSPGLFEECLHPADAQMIVDAQKTLLSEGRVVLDYRFKDRQGRYHWLHDEQSLITHEDGTLEVIGAWWDNTERKEAEQALRESEERVRSIVQIIPDILILTSAQGEYLDIWAASDESLLAPRDETIGKSISDFFPEEEAARILGCIRAAIGTGRLQTVEYEIGLPAGTRSFEARIVPSGEDRALALIRDITGRRQAEQIVRRSEEKYRALVEQAAEGVYLHDMDGHILEVNKAAVSQSGYPEEELIRLNALDLHPGSSAVNEIPETVLAQWRSWSVGESVTIEAEHQRKDGRVIPVEIRTGKVAFGGSEYILALVSDITERKKVEDQLRFQSLVLDQIQDRVTVTDLDGVITYVNEAVERALGYSRKELLGATTDRYSEDPEKGASQREILEETLKRGTWRGEVVNRSADGQEVLLDCRTQVLLDGQGNRVALVGVSTDITEQKQVEDQIRYMSLHDSLTGLYNRYFLEEEMKRLDTGRQLPISIIMADLNGLKLINDAYGHATGDEVLKAAAAILKKSCREEEAIARWGGDEFVILLPQTRAEEAGEICRRIIGQCQEMYVQNVPVSLSLGCACKEGPGQELQEALREAENNMYKGKLIESRSSKSAILGALLTTLREKSEETEMHVRRMQKVSCRIAERMGLSDTELDRLELLVRLHDIGKINVPESFFTKEGPLSEEEWVEIRKHPEIGYRIARATEEFSHVAEEILAHHERWDGSGYPQGTKGEEIPLLARILAIADAYDVMSHGRLYKKDMDPEEVMEEFRKCSGSQFDPELVGIFLSLLEE